jgi:hypothetical protein
VAADPSGQFAYVASVLACWISSRTCWEQQATRPRVVCNSDAQAEQAYDLLTVADEFHIRTDDNQTRFSEWILKSLFVAQKMHYGPQCLS